MIPRDTEQRQKVIAYMISACIIADMDKLTAWEISFIDNVNIQFGQKNDLSDRQCEILEKIYDKL